MEVFSATKVVSDGMSVAKHSTEGDTRKLSTTNNDAQQQDKGRQDESVSSVDAEELVKKMNKDISKFEKNLEFSYDDDIKELVVTIKRKDTGDVVRTIPTKEAIEFAKKMKDMVGGVLFDEKG